METTEKPAETVEKPVEDAGKTKFCKHCGAKIPPDAVICTACGRQVEELKKAAEEPQVVITNANANVNTNNNTMGMPSTRKCNKWVAFCLCLFLGVMGGTFHCYHFHVQSFLFVSADSLLHRRLWFLDLAATCFPLMHHTVIIHIAGRIITHLFTLFQRIPQH